MPQAVLDALENLGRAAQSVAWHDGFEALHVSVLDDGGLVEIEARCHATPMGRNTVYMTHEEGGEWEHGADWD